MPNRVFSTFFTLTVYLIICQIAFGQNLNLKLHKSGISDRDLLGIGQPLTRILNLTVTPNAANDFPDTLRILAIRVEFQEDNTPLTTGNGKFDLSSSIDSNDLLIDPPPHDLNYFEHQLLALANYFKTVSQGKLVLQAEVFPKEPNASYTVAHEMSFYSPTGSEDLLDQ
ncbi:MAG: hypothetical protein ACE5HI_04495, partial [bacterium]